MKLPHDTPKQCDGFLVEELDGEFVLLHPGRNVILHTNETAALIFQLCDGVNTVDAIVSLLGSAYPESASEIAKDVPEVIQNLRAQGVLDGG